MTAWTVREARREEAQALAALEAEAFGAASWGRNAIEDGVRQLHVRTILATAQGETAPGAFAMWRQIDEEAEILTIGVALRLRRKGAARAMLAHIMDACAERGVERLFLEVDAGNAAAIALYAGLGFERIGARRRYYRNGADAAVMRIRLR
jgi:ribosomal-protein-alanine N-acetyltransferase